MPSVTGVFSSFGSGFTATFSIPDDPDHSKCTFSGEFKSLAPRFDSYAATLNYPNLDAISFDMTFEGSVKRSKFQITGRGSDDSATKVVTISGDLAIPVAGAAQNLSGTGTWTHS